MSKKYILEALQAHHEIVRAEMALEREIKVEQP